MTLPQSSPFIKFAILPKNKPIGTTEQITSPNSRKGLFFFQEYNAIAIITPEAHP